MGNRLHVETRDHDYIELIAMDRTFTATQIQALGLARRIGAAKSALAGRVAKAAALLDVAQISEADLWVLIEHNVRRRISLKHD